MTIDTALFQALNDLAGHSNVLDSIAIFFAAYSQYLWVLFIGIIYFFPKRHRMEHHAIALLSLIAAVAARVGVKGFVLLFVERLRPFADIPSAHLLIPVQMSEYLQSFPSGHALFFFAVATVLFRFHRGWGYVAYGAALLMGIARVYTGVHWPSDILAGAFLGAAVGWVVVEIYQRYFANKILKRIKNVPESAI